MAETDETVFTWRGKETVDAVLGNLLPPARVEIVLPVNYNHALFAGLNPEADTAQTEELDIEGDVMLLRKVAGLRGLEDLAALIEPLSGLAATVTVLSPPRIVIVLE
ncbi:MAG: hypothetical protein KKE84_03415 [Gammaproteobacteria bacterium]|nr:hypothetical protein [Gammaproteobacteria bacterium]